MSNNNYLHICYETEKCACGWQGCTCQTKLMSSKVNDNETKYFRLCPKCAQVVSSYTQTTTKS
jgi:hypothetical protein